jgi:hypothetical protein
VKAETRVRLAKARKVKRSSVTRAINQAKEYLRKNVSKTPLGGYQEMETVVEKTLESHIETIRQRQMAFEVMDAQLESLLSNEIHAERIEEALELADNARPPVHLNWN